MPAAFRFTAEPMGNARMRVVLGEKAAIAFNKGISEIDITDYSYSPENNFQFRIDGSFKKRFDIHLTSLYRNLHQKKVYLNNELLSEDQYIISTLGEDIYIKGVKNDDILRIGEIRTKKIIEMERFKERKPTKERFIKVGNFASLNLEPYCNISLNTRYGNWAEEDCLAGLFPGKHFLEGIPCIVVDQNINKGKGAVEGRMTIPIGREAQAIYVLAQGLKNLAVTYDDGKKEELSLTDLGPGLKGNPVVRDCTINLFHSLIDSRRTVKSIQIPEKSKIFAVTLDTEKTILGENLLSNPGFEKFTGTEDDTAEDSFPGWVFHSTSHYAVSEAKEGTTGLKIIYTGKGDNYMCQVYKEESSLANKRFIFSFWAKANKDTESCFFLHSKGARYAGMKYPIITTSWQEYVTEVTLPSDYISDDIWVVIRPSADTTAFIIIDNVNLQLKERSKKELQ